MDPNTLSLIAAMTATGGLTNRPGMRGIDHGGGGAVGGFRGGTYVGGQRPGKTSVFSKAAKTQYKLNQLKEKAAAKAFVKKSNAANAEKHARAQEAVHKSREQLGIKPYRTPLVPEANSKNYIGQKSLQGGTYVAPPPPPKLSAFGEAQREALSNLKKYEHLKEFPQRIHP